MTPDIDVVVDDRSVNLAIAVYPHVVADDAAPHAAAGEDRTARHNRVEGHPHAILVGEYEFDGRILLLPTAQRPHLVVEIEDRRDAHEIHVGFVVGVDGADVPPVERFLAVLVNEVIGKDAMLGNDSRQDVLAEIVCRLLLEKKKQKDWNQK